MNNVFGSSSNFLRLQTLDIVENCMPDTDHGIGSRKADSRRPQQLAGGSWLHASAYLILEDDRPSLVE